VVCPTFSEPSRTRELRNPTGPKKSRLTIQKGKGGSGNFGVALCILGNARAENVPQASTEVAGAKFRQRLKEPSVYDFSSASRPGGQPLQSFWFYGIFQDSSGKSFLYLRHIQYEKTTGKFTSQQVELRRPSGDPCKEWGPSGKWYTGEATSSYNRSGDTLTFASA